MNYFHEHNMDKIRLFSWTCLWTEREYELNRPYRILLSIFKNDRFRDNGLREVVGCTAILYDVDVTVVVAATVVVVSAAVVVAIATANNVILSMSLVYTSKSNNNIWKNDLSIYVYRT